MTPTPPVKPVRAWAIVDEQKRILELHTHRPPRAWMQGDEHIIRGRFVPDAKQGRKG